MEYNTRKIAEERIDVLLKLAEKSLNKPERARRYVLLAKKIGMKHSIRLKEKRWKFCKNCLIPLIVGKSAKIRISNKNKVILCLFCGAKFRKRLVKKP